MLSKSIKHTEGVFKVFVILNTDMKKDLWNSWVKKDINESIRCKIEYV